MGRRILSITFAISLCLLTARTTFADAVDFQTAVGSGGAQTQSGGVTVSQSGGVSTSQSGGAQTPQSGGGAGGGQVQTVDFGDVTGTVCDCGEIPPPGDQKPAAGGGFPKFPLYALAVSAPMICFSGICSSSPPPPQVPEPFTLVTLATGLAALAGLRKRTRK